MLNYIHAPEVARPAQICITEAKTMLADALNELDGINYFKVELYMYDHQEKPTLQMYVRATIHGEDCFIFTTNQTIEGAIAQVLQWYSVKAEMPVLS